MSSEVLGWPIDLTPALTSSNFGANLDHRPLLSVLDDPDMLAAHPCLECPLLDEHALEPLAQVHDLNPPSPPSTFPYRPFLEAAQDMGLIAETAAALAEQPMYRSLPDHEDPAPVIHVDFGAGRQPHDALSALDFDANSGGIIGDDSQFRGTPQGAREYPRELVAAMDFLAEHVGDDIGYLAALVLADEFDVTGEIPDGLPEDIEELVVEQIRRQIADA